MYYVQLYGTIIYNSTGTTKTWQEMYDLDNHNRKYLIKSSVLLEFEWSERRKIKIQYERIRKTSQTMQLNKTKQKRKNYWNKKWNKKLYK